jgi:hypothetical protein
MESNITPNPQDKQITVDVPEDRVAEFHAFFARFLAGRVRRGPAGPGGRSGHRRQGRQRHHGPHGRGCRRRHDDVEPTESSSEVTEV